MPLYYYFSYYTFWFDTDEEEKELIYDEPCRLFKRGVAQEIANEYNRVVLVRKVKLSNGRYRETKFFPNRFHFASGDD